MARRSCAGRLRRVDVQHRAGARDLRKSTMDPSNSISPRTSAPHSRVRRLTILSGGLLAASCGQEPTGGGDSVRERWYQPQAGSAAARPAVLRDLVYFGTGDGKVIARDRATGAARWTAQAAVLSDEIGGSNLIVAAGVVVAPVAYHTVGLDAESGRELWRYRAPLDTVGERQPAPGYVFHTTIDADSQTVYIPAWGASVSAVDLATGQARWVWQPGRAATDTATSGVFRSGSDGVRVSGDTVFATAWHYLVRNGHRSEAWVVALERETGRELWRVTLPVTEMGVGMQAQPALWGNLVLVNTSGGDLFAVNRTSRAVAWRAAPEAPGPDDFLLAVVTSPAVAGDVVYHDGANRHLYARRASDGAMLWKSRGEQFLDDFTITPTRIYSGDGGNLFIFDRASGRLVRKLSEPRDPPDRSLFSSSAAVADGQVFVTVSGGAWSFVEP